MADDEVQVFVSFAYLVGIAARDGTLVERMPYTDAVHERRPADACQRREFVYHARVGYERAASRYASGYLVGDEASQVAGVFVDGVAGVVEHALVDLVHAALYRLNQSATPDDGLEVERDVHAPELVDDELLAKIKLVGHLFVLAQLLCRVAYRSQHQGLGVFVDGYLGRGGTGVDD